MTLNWPFILLWIVILAVILAISYVAMRVVLGPEAAKKNLTYAVPWLLLGGLIGLLIPFLGNYGVVALLGVYTLAVVLWLASWPWRRKGAGEVKLNVGRTTQNKSLLWLSLLTAGGAIALIVLLVDQITGPLSTPAGIISGVVKVLFLCVVPLFFFLLSRSSLVIREHGLAYLFTWQPWERIAAFGWDDDKPSTLLLKVVPRSPISRRYMTFVIPATQVESVDRILEGYLIEDEDLDEEIEGEYAGR